MSKVIPIDAVNLIGGVVTNASKTDIRLLSFGILAAIWSGSGGFNAMIVALNSAYQAKEARPMWKRQLLAIGLTILVGTMMIVSLFLLFLGSQVGSWLASLLGIELALGASAPYIRWLVVAGLTILSVEVLYFLAPNTKQSFLAQLPGAFLAVAIWLSSSLGLGFYLRSSGQFTAVYGALGAMVALMLWFYFSSVAILIGAEMNAQIQPSKSEASHN